MDSAIQEPLFQPDMLISLSAPVLISCVEIWKTFLESLRTELPWSISHSRRSLRPKVNSQRLSLPLILLLCRNLAKEFNLASPKFIGSKQYAVLE